MPKGELVTEDSDRVIQFPRVAQRVNLLIAIALSEGGGGCEPKPAINFQSFTFGKRVRPAGGRSG